jgi:hypothetical protein
MIDMLVDLMINQDNTCSMYMEIHRTSNGCLVLQFWYLILELFRQWGIFSSLILFIRIVSCVAGVLFYLSGLWFWIWVVYGSWTINVTVITPLNCVTVPVMVSIIFRLSRVSVDIADKCLKENRWKMIVRFIDIGGIFTITV